MSKVIMRLIKRGFTLHIKPAVGEEGFVTVTVSAPMGFSAMGYATTIQRAIIDSLVQCICNLGDDLAIANNNLDLAKRKLHEQGIVFNLGDQSEVEEMRIVQAEIERKS